MYDCGPEYLESLDISCTAEEIKAALISESDTINSIYKVDVGQYAYDTACISKWLNFLEFKLDV